jgi:GNAT superfamily N-acetyltransferase
MTAVISVMAPDDRGEFAAIWIPWLRSMGREPEAEDLEIMADPARSYRDAGGEAFLAKIDGKTVGAVAIKRLGDEGFEFCKLVVTEEARGSGLGPALVQKCLDFAADNAGMPLYLQSFNALDVALRLYRRMGFADAAPPTSMNVLARTEVIMMKATATAPALPAALDSIAHS